MDKLKKALLPQHKSKSAEQERAEREAGFTSSTTHERTGGLTNSNVLKGTGLTNAADAPASGEPPLKRSDSPTSVYSEEEGGPKDTGVSRGTTGHTSGATGTTSDVTSSGSVAHNYVQEELAGNRPIAESSGLGADEHYAGTAGNVHGTSQDFARDDPVSASSDVDPKSTSSTHNTTNGVDATSASAVAGAGAGGLLSTHGTAPAIIGTRTGALIADNASVADTTASIKSGIEGGSDELTGARSAEVQYASKASTSGPGSSTGNGTTLTGLALPDRSVTSSGLGSSSTAGTSTGITPHRGGPHTTFTGNRLDPAATETIPYYHEEEVAHVPGQESQPTTTSTTTTEPTGLDATYITKESGSEPAPTTVTSGTTTESAFDSDSKGASGFDPTSGQEFESTGMASEIEGTSAPRDYAESDPVDISTVSGGHGQGYEDQSYGAPSSVTVVDTTPSTRDTTTAESSHIGRDLAVTDKLATGKAEMHKPSPKEEVVDTTESTKEQLPSSSHAGRDVAALGSATALGAGTYGAERSGDTTAATSKTTGKSGTSKEYESEPNTSSTSGAGAVSDTRETSSEPTGPDLTGLAESEKPAVIRRWVAEHSKTTLASQALSSDGPSESSNNGSVSKDQGTTSTSSKRQGGIYEPSASTGNNHGAAAGIGAADVGAAGVGAAGVYEYEKSREPTRDVKTTGATSSTTAPVTTSAVTSTIIDPETTSGVNSSYVPASTPDYTITAAPTATEYTTVPGRTEYISRSVLPTSTRAAPPTNAPSKTEAAPKSSGNLDYASTGSTSAHGSNGTATQVTGNRDYASTGASSGHGYSGDADFIGNDYASTGATAHVGSSSTRDNDYASTGAGATSGVPLAAATGEEFGHSGEKNQRQVQPYGAVGAAAIDQHKYDAADDLEHHIARDQANRKHTKGGMLGFLHKDQKDKYDDPAERSTDAKHKYFQQHTPSVAESTESSAAAATREHEKHHEPSGLTTSTVPTTTTTTEHISAPISTTVGKSTGREYDPYSTGRTSTAPPGGHYGRNTAVVGEAGGLGAAAAYESEEHRSAKPLETGISTTTTVGQGYYDPHATEATTGPTGFATGYTGRSSNNGKEAVEAESYGTAITTSDYTRRDPVASAPAPHATTSRFIEAEPEPEPQPEYIPTAPITTEIPTSTYTSAPPVVQTTKTEYVERHEPVVAVAVPVATQQYHATTITQPPPQTYTQRQTQTQTTAAHPHTTAQAYVAPQAEKRGFFHRSSPNKLHKEPPKGKYPVASTTEKR